MKKYRFYIIIFIVAAGMLSETAFAQPMLIVGEGSAEVKAALSYGFISSPLRKHFEQNEAKVIINVPINISQPLHSVLEEFTGDYMVIPQFTASAKQGFNTSIDISKTLLNGVAFFAVRENVSLNVLGAIGNANIRINSLGGDEGEGKIMLLGGVNIPLKFDMHWRTISFGYTLQPTRHVRIGFQLHKQYFYASTAGNLRTSLAGRIEQVADENVISVDIVYPEERVYGNVDGSYQGTAWAPEIGIQVGPFGLVSRMGLEIRAKGSLESNYSIPFFMDKETFELKFTEPDSFLSVENLPRMLNAEVETNTYRVTDNLHIRIPQSHTLSFDFLKDRLYFSYTKTFGKLEMYTSSGSENKDSTYMSTGDYLNTSLFADHIMVLTAKLSWFSHNIGVCAFDVGYRDNHHLYSDLVKDFFASSFPLMPIWNFGFKTGGAGRFSLDFYIAPLPSVQTGFQYVF
ncbi:MAG: hypothetical protein HQK83_11890 [Fibrobacteria bacterium]|nr:hypothetical protein [Fibrobacteria bacterium]